METVKKYLYNFFTQAELLVPNIPLSQINSTFLHTHLEHLKNGKEPPPILVFEQNNIKFIAAGTHEYLACLMLNKPLNIITVDNIGIEPAHLPYLFYQEWYRTLTNIRAQHSQC